MQKLRWLIITLLLIIIGIVQAQNDDAYELPAVQNGDTVDGRFEENVISQLYGFYATAGDTLTIRMVQEGESSLDPFLVLLDSTGAVLAYDDDSGGQLSALINYDVEEDGTYFVLATSFYNGYVDGTETETSEQQDYSLTISGQSTPADVEDPETVSLELNSLNFGDSVRGESSLDNPVAFFIFDGVAGTTASLNVTTDSFFNSVVYLFAPDGSRIAVDPSVISMDLEEDGIYLVMVADYVFYQAIDDNSDFEGGEFSLDLSD